MMGVFPPEFREAQAIGPGPKRSEDDPLDEQERVLCDALSRLLTLEGFEYIDRVLLLQMVRGYHYEEQRLEKTYEVLCRCLEWRRSVGADSVLHKPSRRVLDDHAEWRQAWHMDIYGADAAGHPIMGHRLGLIDPVAFLQRFPVDAIKVNYMRDMEFLQWHKEQISLSGPRTIYKQISILDMTNLGFAHTGSNFRGPISEVVALLQDFYPEGTLRVYIVNTPMIFRVMWAAVKPMLHPVTVANITILGYDKEQIKSAFRDAGMEPDQLPTWAGGTREDGVLCKYCTDGSPALLRAGHAEGGLTAEDYQISLLQDASRLFRGSQPLVRTHTDPESEPAADEKLKLCQTSATLRPAPAPAPAPEPEPESQRQHIDEGDLSVAAVEALNRYYCNVDTDPGPEAILRLSVKLRNASPRAISCWFQVKRAVELANVLAHSLRPKVVTWAEQSNGDVGHTPPAEYRREENDDLLDESSDDDLFHDALEHEHDLDGTPDRAGERLNEPAQTQPRSAAVGPELNFRANQNTFTIGSLNAGATAALGELGAEQLSATIFWQLSQLHEALELHSRRNNGNGNCRMRVADLKRLLTDKKVLTTIGLGDGLSDAELDEAVASIKDLSSQQHQDAANEIGSDCGSLYGTAEESPNGSRSVLRAGLVDVLIDEAGTNASTEDCAVIDTYQVELWWKRRVWPHEQLAAAMLGAG